MRRSPRVHLALAAAFLLGLSACAGGGAPDKGTPEGGAASSTGVLPASAELAGEEALTIPEYGREPGPRTRHRRSLFSSLECQAGPGETCRGSYRFQADPGFQVCWMNYDLPVQEGRVRFVATPSGFLAEDPQSPDRFTALDVLIEAEGGPLSAARIRAEDGFFWMLPLSSNEDDRRALGCRLPNRG